MNIFTEHAVTTLLTFEFTESQEKFLSFFWDATNSSNIGPLGKEEIMTYAL